MVQVVRAQVASVVLAWVVAMVLVRMVLVLDGSLAERSALVLAREVSEGMFPSVEHGQAVTVAGGLVRVPMGLVDSASI